MRLEYSDQQHAADEGEPVEQPQVQRIDMRQSPYLDAFVDITWFA